MAKKTKKIAKANILQSRTKIYLYLVSLSCDPDFVEEIKKIRKEYNLPPNGYEKNITDEFEFINSIPPYIKQNEDEVYFQQAIYHLSCRYKLALPWIEQITKYVLYDDFFFSETTPLVETIPTVEMIDNEEEDLDLDIDYRQRALKNIYEGFPVAIFISPYATGKDIIDYIKKRYKKEIEPIQLKHREPGVKIGKIRKRNQEIQNRDNFICKHRDLPAGELVTRVNREFGIIMDYTYLNKIIRKKCKKGK